jgi:hypothetical protein
METPENLTTYGTKDEDKQAKLYMYIIFNLIKEIDTKLVLKGCRRF